MSEHTAEIDLREARVAQRRWRSEMERALALGVCFITADGWCATHSTGDGPVYCTRITPAAKQRETSA